MSSDYLHCFPDPLPLEEMFYDRAKNPLSQTGLLCVAQAEWGGGERGGGHNFHHASLHGTSNSAELGVWAMQASGHLPRTRGQLIIWMMLVLRSSRSKCATLTGSTPCQIVLMWPIAQTSSLKRTMRQVHTLWRRSKQPCTVLERKLMPWQPRGEASKDFEYTLPHSLSQRAHL